ncbi:MAG: DUF4012 domain-containing protein, partial [Dehalococcoidia bacterium]
MSVVVVGLLVFGGERALALRRHLLNGGRDLQAAQQVLSDATGGGEAFRISTADLDRTDASLIQAQAHFAAARSDLDGLNTLLAVFRHAPVVGASVAAVPDTIDFVDAATAGARQLVSGLRPVAKERETPSQGIGATARFSIALSTGLPRFQLAQRDLQQAQRDRSAIKDNEVLAPLRGSLSQLAQWDRQWPRVRSDLELLVRLPAVAHAVLGYDGTHTYAIVGQNSAELRPTGGFPGTMGIVQFANGELTQQDYRSIYDYDPDNRGASRPLPPAPAPIAEHLGIAGWHIQDATWSPDFPTSARSLRAFLDYDTGTRVDGVIAFDSYAVQELLRALGPVDVTIDGQTEHFTADNWLPLTTQLIFLDPEHPDSLEGKNRILAPLLRTVVARINGVNGDQLTGLLQTLRGSVAERHILFQFDDPVAQGFVYQYGTDGGVRLTPGQSVIYPVEANLSYTKIGPFIRQHSVYELWFDETGVCQRAHVALTWQNTVTAQLIADPVNRIEGDEWDATSAKLVKSTGVYGLYERLYVPGGAALLGESGIQEPISQTSDGDFSVFGTYLSVHPGETRELGLELHLPNREPERGHFVLTLLKQPGTQDRTVDVIVHTAGIITPRSNPALSQLDRQTYRYRGAIN